MSQGQEGQHPNRGDPFKILRLLRTRRAEFSSSSVTGLLTDDGQEWHATRVSVQQDMMRPRSALFYVGQLQDVAGDFVDFVARGGTMKDQGRL